MQRGAKDQRRLPEYGAGVIRVVLADDSFLVREAITQLLSSAPEFELVAVSDRYDRVMEAIDEHTPDVVVSDIRMPPTGVDEGIQMAERLRASHPEIGVVILSQYLEASYVLRLLDGGSARRGYLLKDRITHRNQLATAIEQVAEGGSVIDPLVVDSLVRAREQSERSPLAELTPRERDVLSLVAQGKSNASIATELFLTKRAVEKHINAIFAKLKMPEENEISRRVVATLVFLSHSEDGLPPAAD
jgi:DNA-binding NarL/FixJ family response regulator